MSKNMLLRTKDAVLGDVDSLFILGKSYCSYILARQTAISMLVFDGVMDEREATHYVNDLFFRATGMPFLADK